MSMFSQCLALIAPLYFIWFLNSNYGKLEVVSFESMLSLIAFFAVIQDYGTSIFLSHRPNKGKVAAKLVGTTVVLKLYLTCFFSLILLLMYFIFGGGPEVYVFSFILLVISSFDLPFIFFSAGKSHYYAFLLALKIPITILINEVINEPYISYMVSSIVIVVFSFSYGFRLIGSRIIFSKRIFWFLLAKYRTYTVTESLTSVFSQLDGFLVSRVLNADQAFIYLLVRKVVRAANALLAYVYRIAYTRVKRNESGVGNVYKLIFVFNVASVGVINLSGEAVFDLLFGLGADPDNILSSVILIQSLVLLIGSFKSTLRNVYLFVHEKFVVHLVCTLFSVAVFIIPIAGYYYYALDASAIFISNLRLSSDILYLIMSISFLFLSKRYST